MSALQHMMSPVTPAGLANRPSGALERALLPWEDADAFLALLAGFHAAHAPVGPTETGLVERLAWTEWRRRRLALAERALHMAALQSRMKPSHGDSQIPLRARLGGPAREDGVELQQVVLGSEAEDAADAGAIEADAAMVAAALEVLAAGGAGAYARALATLRDDTRGWWLDWLAESAGEDPPAWVATAQSLERFLRKEVVPHLETTRRQIGERPAIRLQAHGESLDPDRMDRLLAIDDRLLRQTEKTLAMLIRLQERRPRRPTQAGWLDPAAAEEQG